MNEELIDDIYKRYKALNLDPEVFLKGMMHNKPISYWDYVEVNTLLSLQKPRTDFKDEFIFIVYHQITELVLRLMVHELEQMTDRSQPIETNELIIKIGRLDRYTDLLINSFSIMNKGMDYDQYNQFRLSLAPASGFQSAQFRMIELYCTDIDNLINERSRVKMPSQATIKDKFNFIYWQEAGLDRNTGVKSVTLSEFEHQYLESFVTLAERMELNNLNRICAEMDKNGNLTTALRAAFKDLDRKFNIAWPIVHLETAQTYLAQKGETKAATGGSNWVKYLHPKYQRRIFFPSLLTDIELAQWGE